jgi:hypothetical protein
MHRRFYRPERVEMRGQSEDGRRYGSDEDDNRP